MSWNPHYVCKKCQEEKYPIVTGTSLVSGKCVDCGEEDAYYLVAYPRRYTEEQIAEAFRVTFHDSGEQWYGGEKDDCDMDIQSLVSEIRKQKGAEWNPCGVLFVRYCTVVS